jgi:two-component system, OmpR family, catabolic regulation response regulator CreB
MSMKPTILVVEDEPAVADAIVYALRTEGCDPVHVTTGTAALAALRRRAPDLVVLDVGLPDANGFDLCREIRRSHDLPIIFLTARSQETDRVVGLELGADDYVVKPFSPRELAARVRAVLRRSAPHPEAPPEAACIPLDVDEARRSVRYFDQALDLTRTEYRLLTALLRRPGWVLSRERLLQELWDDPGATTERAIDSHIKALRSKLRAVRPDVEAIETHRGEGYSLRERW